MNKQALASTAQALVCTGRGILAMDESNETCNHRLAAAGIAPTPEHRRAWRELILTTPRLGDAIAGVILYDETIAQATGDGVAFLDCLAEAGILPGIKVDIGAKDLAGRPGEQITEGLDGLRTRLEKYFSLGARFAKWRAVISPADPLPSRGAMQANAQALARYAALCQEAGVVPIVEPEVLMTGRHDLARCRVVTEQLLQAVFQQLDEQGVALECLILKPNMVLPGLDCAIQDSISDVAEVTIATMRRTVPAAVPGIAFLSGGQSGRLASARLNAMNLIARNTSQPWSLTFSFARAIQQPALEIWQGEADRVHAAQTALAHRATCNRDALSGHYDPAMECA